MGMRSLRLKPPSRLVPIISTSPETMVTARLGQMVTLSPRRLAEQPLRRDSVAYLELEYHESPASPTVTACQWLGLAGPGHAGHAAAAWTRTRSLSGGCGAQFGKIRALLSRSRSESGSWLGPGGARARCHESRVPPRPRSRVWPGPKPAVTVSVESDTDDSPSMAGEKWASPSGTA
jgi:hypothetical protein